ncbi:MAG TPA: hypothetical protein PLX09_02560 [Xanthomonadaceae bacterium]|nr:hypothetical protein [Xanthomonadaceae bacterium]
MSASTLQHPLRIALHVLRFFSLPAVDQLAIGRSFRTKSDPVFFDPDHFEGNFFFGMACAFVTYKGALLDEFESEADAETLLDFSHRLAVLMHGATGEEWADLALLQSDDWQRLRRDACRAVLELHAEDRLDGETFEFNISELINADDFRTTDAAKDVLS